MSLNNNNSDSWSLKKRSVIWDYFEKIDSVKALCTLCNEEYSFKTTTGNLSAHLKKKHYQTYLEAEDKRRESGDTDGKEKVIYLVTEKSDDDRESSIKNTNLSQEELAQEWAKQHENGDTDGKEEEFIYIVAEKSNDDTEPTSRNTADKLESRFSKRTSIKNNRLSQGAHDRRQKNIIAKLTQDKIQLTATQKELMSKEIEEKTLKVLLLQKEMEHKENIYKLEKQEMEHKIQMQQLAKEEMLLKIELLKGSVAKLSIQHDESSSNPFIAVKIS